MALRFDGRVAIVTGAGNGLGKCYAKMLAERGCKVVVNDLGGGFKGEGRGKGKHVADVVVDEIIAAGGEAVANYDSVEAGDKIVETAIKAFGKIDIVINNAGILRDKSFKRMGVHDWDLIVKVHLNGVFAVTKAAWVQMLKQGYGRIVTVSSPAGLYGNFGQANYSMAKMGMVGLMQSLAIEGGKKGIHTNTIAPIAGTRMLATVMPENMLKALKQEYISTLVLYLCHESCKENGAVIECGGGTYQKVQLTRSEGWSADLSKGDPSLKDLADNWAAITDMSNAKIAKKASTSAFKNLGAYGKL